MDACLILLRYLTDTSVSPLQKEFVETDDPYASKVTIQMIFLYEDKT
jgi:Zn-dependent M16 (insulinase) family peptidase